MLPNYLERLAWPYYIRDKDTYSIVKQVVPEGKTTCGLCSRLRRGSLYGFAQELYKDVGDWIEASDVIASVGDSGGQSRSGLYFEIRKQGKPVNPSQWCSNKVRHVALQDE